MKFKFDLASVSAVLLAVIFVPPLMAQKRGTPVKSARSIVNSLDGNWTGKTLQNQTVKFTVEKGKVKAFTIGGRFIGAGCSTTSTTTISLDRAILNKSFTHNSYAGPGGVSVAINGVFAGPVSARGTASLRLHGIPGPPPGVPGYVPSCDAQVQTKWAAVKGDTPPEDIRGMLEPARTKKSGVPSVVLMSPK